MLNFKGLNDFKCGFTFISGSKLTLFECVSAVKIQPPPAGPTLLGVLVYSLLPLVILSLALVIACWTYHQRKPPYGHVDLSQVRQHLCHSLCFY